MDLSFDRTIVLVDGTELTLADVVIDPQDRQITHLVVQPERRHDLARLVEFGDFVDTDGTLRLNASTPDLERYPLVEKERFIRMADFGGDDEVDWGHGIANVLALPFMYGEFEEQMPSEYTERWDSIPQGEVELRRQSEVVDAEHHHIGHVEGFICQGKGFSHLVLQRGHFLGKRRVAIPISAVEKVEDDQAVLTLTKKEVAELPPLKSFGLKRPGLG